jgi:hypothetical protein
MKVGLLIKFGRQKVEFKRLSSDSMYPFVFLPWLYEIIRPIRVIRG